jgi:hypothetical protein
MATLQHADVLFLHRHQPFLGGAWTFWSRHKNINNEVSHCPLCLWLKRFKNIFIVRFMKFNSY